MQLNLQRQSLRVYAKQRANHIFAACLLVSLVTAVVLQGTGILYRAELQMINRLFEARPWLAWSPTSLQRFNPPAIWNYHQAHEIPRTIFSWDYTLSWLIENNHPPVQHKFIIFNHQLEDEPPTEALAQHPWLQPLMHYPTPRKTIADCITFLARSGARLIILDNDFPQYSQEDEDLATAIYRAASGKTSGHPVPVLMASTVNHRAFNHVVQLDTTTLPVGVLQELQKLEPTVDVKDKYTGITSIAPDEDQVVRRLVSHLSAPDGGERDSLVLKALERMGESMPEEIPLLMDIDFAAPPNSESYPVRPFWYLLDPQKQAQMNTPSNHDVTIKDAVVLLGDGVIDLYPTPGTNADVNMMSGSELLAQSMDTVTRHSWPRRLSGAGTFLYNLACCIFGSLLVAWSRRLRPRNAQVALRSAVELGVYAAILIALIGSSMALFAFAGFIVPILVPAVALSAGVAAAVIVERERVRTEALRSRLAAAQSTLEAERRQHETQLRLQEAQAQAEKVREDQKRRQEFVRRLNHDLKAPITVLNWTLAKLKKEGLTSAKAAERVEHLERTSDRLFDLMAQLIRNYENTALDMSAQQAETQSICELGAIISRCVELEAAMAEMRQSHIRVHLPEYPLPVSAARIDMERVFTNILRNALIHNPSGITVDVSARVKAQFVRIAFSDDGCGIPKQVLPQIFEAGFSASSQRAQGEGLGLAIVKTIVENYGGKVKVESAEDAGTTVVILLPCMADTVVSSGSIVGPPTTQSNEDILCRKL